MRIAATGYGAGTREYKDFPNVLRVVIGNTDEDAAATRDAATTDDEKLLRRETLMMIETNLDDTTPQVLGYVSERAFALGALDCFFTPVQMKKNRPGTLVSILCRPTDRELLTKLLFDETTTLGVRSYEVERRALEREFVSVETKFGAISVKVARGRDGRVRNVAPEFEDCRAAALGAGVPLREVEAAARAAFYALPVGEKGNDESERG
jgi:uncharacterized protein (DUF111 family)